MKPGILSPERVEQSYGQQKLTLVDRFGVYLSRRAILRWLPAREGLRVLDVGCGYHATLLRALLPHLASGTGIDLQIADHVRKIPNLSFEEAPVEDALAALPRWCFDLVLLISVLEHLSDPLQVLQDCLERLRPGGVLLVNVPTWTGKTFLEFSAFKLGLSPALEIDDHKMYYGKRDLWPLLVKAGFRPSRISLRYHKFGLNLFAVARAA